MRAEALGSSRQSFARDTAQAYVAAQSHASVGPLPRGFAMPVELRQFLCLRDNFGVLLHDSTSGATAAIDAPEAAPIEAALAERGWRLTDILVTHHHNDHTA